MQSEEAVLVKQGSRMGSVMAWARSNGASAVEHARAGIWAVVSPKLRGVK